MNFLHCQSFGFPLVIHVLNGTVPGHNCLQSILELDKALSCHQFFLQFMLTIQLIYVCTFSRGLRIVLYADDILLLAPSISALESLLNLCERELDQLDMVINNKKSCCIRIGPVWQAELTFIRKY